MIVEAALFVAFTILAGVAIVKAYEWHQGAPLGRRRD